MRKLGASNERELFDFAAQQGLVLPNPDSPQESPSAGQSDWL